MIILESARKHGILDLDMLAVVAEPYVIAELREEPEKLLYFGFDSKARAIEVISDTGKNGEVYIIHADKITPEFERLLEEVLR